MAIVARGSIADRPFGRTFYAIAARRFTGDLTIESAGKRYVVGWRDGAVVAAYSPLPADAIARIALTAHLITSTQVVEVMRATPPGADEVDAIAETARLGPEKADRLRRRAVGHRAMRMFALEHGELVLDDQPALPQRPDLAIDARAILYAGVKAHFGDARLSAELAALGAAFRLEDAAVPHLAQYGFTEADRPVLALLRRQAMSPDALVAAVPDLDPKVVRALVYALAVTGAAEATETAADPKTPAVDRVSPPELATDDSSTRRVPLRKRASTAPAIKVSPPTQPSPRGIDAAAILGLVRDGLAKLDAGADHFELLGISREASADQIRAAYFHLARHLHPDRLAAAGISEEVRDAQRLFAQINAAFGVLSNPRRHTEYLESLRAGGEKSEAAVEATADRLFAAEEAFRKGEMALRRNQLAQAIAEFARAVELNPDEGDHHAMHAWATWCADDDKGKASPAAIRSLTRAAQLSPKSAVPFVYLGRIARSIGRDQEAIRHFQQALELVPGHVEASSELRVLEGRLRQRPDDKARDKRGGGLFGRFRR